MEGHAFEHYDAAGTVVPLPDNGILKKIIVNTTAAGTIKIYDGGVTGKLIASLKSNVAEGTYSYDIAIQTNLTIVLAAASDITVVYD